MTKLERIKEKMRPVLYRLMWVGLVLGTLLLNSFINSSLEEEKCKDVLVKIEDENDLRFVSKGDVMNWLNRDFQTPVSQKIKDIDTWAIEQKLESNEAIENAEVYITIDGYLIIDLKQRRPILRVYDEGGSFYLDQWGNRMSVSDKFTAHVPVANGHLKFNHKNLNFNRLSDVPKNDSVTVPAVYKDLYSLAQYLDNHPFWNAQIEQFYVNKDSEFELIPRVGNHTIVLGEVYDLDMKFNKLMDFYENGLAKTGWNEYLTINLKFHNQVVCTKRYN